MRALIWSDQTLNWINFGLAALGIILTIAGFWIAIVQIRKTKTAAEATNRAARVGTKRIRYNQLLVLAPQMAGLEPELDAAVSRNDRFAAERALVRWRQTATQAAGILREIDSKYSDLAEQIERTCATARNAKAKLPEVDEEGAGKTVQTVTAALRKDLSAAADILIGIVGNLATEVEGGSTDA